MSDNQFHEQTRDYSPRQKTDWLRIITGIDFRPRFRGSLFGPRSDKHPI
jgi:hypothetical protein